MSRAYAPHWKTKELARRASLLPGVERVRIIPPKRALWHDSIRIRPTTPTQLMVSFADGDEFWTLAEARRRTAA